MGGLPAVKAIFYGVSPAVIALILHSCYRLTKLGMKDWLERALGRRFHRHRRRAGGGRVAVHHVRRGGRAVLRLPVPGAGGCVVASRLARVLTLVNKIAAA